MSHYPNHGPPYGPYGHHGNHGPPPYGFPPPHHGYPPQPPHAYPVPPTAYVPVPYVVPGYPVTPTYPAAPTYPATPTYPAAPTYPTSPGYPSTTYPHAQENPTYITNYIVQPPAEPVAEAPLVVPEPVRVVDNAPYISDEIDWIPATTLTALNYASRAVVAGHEGWDNSALWVIRAYQGGELLPGKFAAKHRIAYIPNAGRELSVHNFEVLSAAPGSFRWLPASNGQVPVGAIPAGNTVNAEPLYIGRAKHLQSLTPGKIHPSHHCLYISFGGKEVALKNYEVLCRIVG